MSKRLIPLLIIAVGVAGFVLLKITRPEPQAVNPQERIWRVEVMTVEPDTHTPVLHLYGQVVAPEQATLSVTLAGRIKNRPVHEGQQVKEGDLLVALDDADVQPVLAQAKADVSDLQAQIESEHIRYHNDQKALEGEKQILENARTRLERTRSLVVRDLSSQETLDAASDALARVRLSISGRELAVAGHPARLQSLKARLARAEAVLASATRDVQGSRLTAPFDGVVTGIQVAPGDQVSKSTPLLSIYPDRGLELRAKVPDEFRQELLQALQAGTELEAMGETTGHRFAFSRFAGTSDPSGTEAILTLVGDAGGLRPGGLLAVTLERPPRPHTVSIPYSALYGANSVYLMTDEGRMERAWVQRVGEAQVRHDERRVLVSGPELARGRKLITTHLPNAMTGLRVQVASAGAEKAE